MKNLEPYAKAGIITAILTTLTVGLCVAAFTVSRWRNDSMVAQAQKAYYERLTENVGKDQTIIQKYEYNKPK